MKITIGKVVKNKIVFVLKLIFSILVVAWFCRCVYINGVDKCYTYKDYTYQNTLVDPIFASECKSIEQVFVSKGNILSNINLYFGEIYDTDLKILLKD